MDIDRIKALRERAEKAADLYDLLNETFPNIEHENLILVFMAAIQDGYLQGLKDK